ncbi:unnamed protein product [Rhizophagus irregularis]|uniref:Uncharacterized protein n=1 Tax=Rhizophagus irregularis TaxID=588596 RepID=A0A2I1HC29_9GLOM|nr:hypothetical protein RhiirA4_476758 [Rhizophagus irregularis]CAB4445351.1 unnamed protein product [Rhizophagus irregularis]
MPSSVTVLCQIKSKGQGGGFISGLASYMIEHFRIQVDYEAGPDSRLRTCIKIEYSNVKITSNDDDEQMQDVIIKKEDDVVVNSTCTSKADGQDLG